MLVQAADTERSVYISNLLPLLAEFDLQPTVTDAHSMVSAIKVIHFKAYSMFHIGTVIRSSYCIQKWRESNGLKLTCLASLLHGIWCWNPSSCSKSFPWSLFLNRILIVGRSRLQCLIRSCNECDCISNLVFGLNALLFFGNRFWYNICGQNWVYQRYVCVVHVHKIFGMAPFFCPSAVFEYIDYWCILCFRCKERTKTYYFDKIGEQICCTTMVASILSSRHLMQ